MNITSIRGISGVLAFATAAIFVAGATSPVSAATDPSAEASASAPLSAQEAQRKYCVEYKHSGTRIARKTCKTREEWIKQTGVDPARK